MRPSSVQVPLVLPERNEGLLPGKYVHEGGRGAAKSFVVSAGLRALSSQIVLCSLRRPRRLSRTCLVNHNRQNTPNHRPQPLPPIHFLIDLTSPLVTYWLVYPAFSNSSPRLYLSFSNSCGLNTTSERESIS